MYSLFWNIFVSFWLAMIITGIAIAWYTERLSEDEVPPLFMEHNRIFTEQSLAAKEMLETYGIVEFVKWKSNKKNLKGIADIYVLDEYGAEWDHKVLSTEAESFIYGKNSGLFNSIGDATLKSILSFSVSTPKGKQFTLITTFKKPHPLFYLLTSQRIVIGIIVSGLICFALARYLSTPIVRLRQTVLQLAMGNFDARIGEVFRNRKDEIGGVAKDFDLMADRLQTMLNTQKQLLRDISHELRSPLARMQVALALARKQHHIPIQSELQRIEIEIERLNVLIDRLLTFVRMETDREITDKSYINVKELLENIVNDTQFETSQSQQHKIQIECPDNLELKVNAQLIHRAFENIIRNACFYSPNGTQIKIKCVPSNNNALIMVQDEGPGVPAHMLEKIFDPFVRVSNAREQTSGGYGIGLAIAKRAIEIHGGTIRATNLKEKGMLMSVNLPFIPSQSSLHSHNLQTVH